jgi:hypothetical protein
VPITSLCDSVTVSDFKPGKRGLNSRLRPVLQGGGGLVLSLQTFYSVLHNK